MHSSLAFLNLALATFACAIPAPAAQDSPTTKALEKRVTHNGVATYYEQGGAAGSCGQYHSDSDYIGALSTYWMNSGTNYCDRKVQITNSGGGQSNNGQGKTITITVADTCPGCDENHIDLSEGAFKGLTGGHLDPPGEFNIAWHFCNVNGQC